MPQISQVNLNTSLNKNLRNQANNPALGGRAPHPTAGRQEDQMYSSNPSEKKMIEQWQEEVQNLGLKSNASISFKGEVGIDTYGTASLDRRKEA